MPLPSEQHQNTTSEYTPCKTDTHRGMIKHILGCLGKAPPDKSLFNMSDYIIQQFLQNSVNDTCNIYLDELKDSLGIICGRDVSESTIWRTLKCCGYHMKKVGNHLDPVSLKYTIEIFSQFLIQLTRNAIERSVQKWAKYITKIASKYTSNQLVFVDESSADRWTTYHGYAWAWFSKMGYWKC